MWDNRYGGTKWDRLTSFQQTQDGGFILGGRSNSSISGDKTQDTIGIYDYWIVKIDWNGNKQWDKTYGGTDIESLWPVVQSHDGGYMIGGYSRSGIGGDKTGPTWGVEDYWVIKLDASGNKQWDKDFGGTKGDLLYTSIQTSDGGYLLGGWTTSDSTGDKTYPNYDTTLYTSDYWIIKIDSLGNKEWDKSYGGIGIDELYSINKTVDGGFLLGGVSSSNISGDKSENDKDSLDPKGDFWILKIDSFGNKQWDKTIGGPGFDYLLRVANTKDGGFILGGRSSSGIGADKTQDTCGAVDLWIVKIDGLGNKQWDKDFGGTDQEYMWSIQQTTDNGFSIGAASYSNNSCNKSENNLGIWQSWFLKTDSIGNLQWDKTLLVDGKSTYGYAIEVEGGCYIFADDAMGSISGYKSQNNWDTTDLSTDLWVVKFCDSLHTNINPISNHGSVFSIYPNPASEKLFLNSSVNIVSLKILDFIGIELFTETVFQNKVEMDIRFLSRGIYFLQVQTEKGNVVKKFIKE